MEGEKARRKVGGHNKKKQRGEGEGEKGHQGKKNKS